MGEVKREVPSLPCHAVALVCIPVTDTLVWPHVVNILSLPHPPQVDFEKGQVKKLEKEAKKLTASLEEERAASAKHKQVALMLIKERKKIMEHMVVLQHRNSQVESTLKGEEGRMKNFAEGLAEESRKSVQMEAAMEKQLAEFDVEREHLKQDLAREEQRNQELSREVEHLRGQLEQMQKQFGAEKRGDGPQSIEIKSTAVLGRSPIRDVGIVNQIEHGIPSQGHTLEQSAPCRATPAADCSAS